MLTPQGDICVKDRDELDSAYQSGELSKKQYDDAILEGEKIIRELASDIEKTEKYCIEILNRAETMIKDDVFTVFLDIVGVLPDTLIDVPQELLVEQEPVAETPVEKAKIFIVGGCFSSEENANKLVISLKDRGYESAFVKQRGKLWDVYYGKYQTMEEAKLALKEIKENSDSKAWIMVGK